MLKIDLLRWIDGLLQSHLIQVILVDGRRGRRRRHDVGGIELGPCLGELKLFLEAEFGDVVGEEHVTADRSFSFILRLSWLVK